MNQPANPVATAFVSRRSRIVQAIHSPLGFCALALLIVEVFILSAGVWFDLPLSWRVAALGVGVLLFLIVFGAVVFLIINYPQNLVFSEESHVQTEAMRLYGTDAHALTGYEVRSMSPEIAPTAPLGQLPAEGETH